MVKQNFFQEMAGQNTRSVAPAPDPPYSTLMTLVPHDELQPATLRALIEEFVTREGGIHGHADVSLDVQIEQVERQLRAGLLVIVFDEASQTCTIAVKRDLPPAGFEDGPRVEPADFEH